MTRHHYILVQGTRIVADCLVDGNSMFPASMAQATLDPIRDRYPGSAIYIRLGNEAPLDRTLIGVRPGN